jgi:hypothetical protein
MLSHGMCATSYTSLNGYVGSINCREFLVARVNSRGGTKCNDVHHQPEGTVACFCGSHGGGEWQTWPGNWRSTGPTRTRTRTDPLRVRPLHCYRPTVQRRPVSQSGFSPAPHCPASKHCHAADLDYREIHVEARASDVMAGAEGTAGPAPDIRHQPTGDSGEQGRDFCV